MSSSEDQFQLKQKTDAQLHEWIVANKPGSPEYNAGIYESMRRVAIMEALLEKKEAPVRKREFIAIIIALMSLAVAIAVIIMTDQ